MKIKTFVASLFAALAMTGLADPEVVDVYTFKMSVKQPYLQAGVRTYTSVTLKGSLYLEYDVATEGITAAYAEVVNNKTKVKHTITFSDGLYNLMGKASKTSDKSLPTVAFIGADTECVQGEGKGAQEPHEAIKSIALGGNGSIKHLKGVQAGCGACGMLNGGKDSCEKLKKMSGNVVGVMDCECPDDEDWDHTLATCACGIKVDAGGNTERSHYAAFFGTWTAEWNKKLSK